MFINAGINVLCEKPFTVNATEAKAIIDLAKQKNVFVMEVSHRSNVLKYFKRQKCLHHGS